MSDTLQALKDEAKALGIKVHHRAGEESIRKAIASHSANTYSTPTIPLSESNAPEFGRGKVMSEKEFKTEQLANRKRMVGALRRIRVVCMNPLKSDWDGEMISVGSARLGTFKKYVPFNGKPYHVPQIIYDVLRERKCTIFNTVRERGQNFKKPEIISEFAIEDLPPLTSKELEDLAHRQALAETGL